MTMLIYLFSYHSSPDGRVVFFDFLYSLAYSMRKMMADKALVCMRNVSELSFHMIIYVMWAMSIYYVLVRWF